MSLDVHPFMGVNGSGDPNRVAIWSSSNLLVSDNNLIYDPTTDRLGIGVTPLWTLDVLTTLSAPGTTAEFYVQRIVHNVTLTANGTPTLYALDVENNVAMTSTFAIGSMAAINAIARASGDGSGPITSFAGIRSQVQNSSSKAIDGIGFHATVPTNTGSGSFSTYTAFNAPAHTVGTSIYGFRSQIAAGTNRYNVYADGTAPNLFNGDVSIVHNFPVAYSQPVLNVDLTQTNVTGGATHTAGTFSVSPTISAGATTTIHAVIGRISVSPAGNTGPGTCACFYADLFVQSTSGTVPAMTGFRTSFQNTGTGTTTVSTARAFHADAMSKGASRVVTKYSGFVASNSDVAVTTIGFESSITSGTNKWNIYADGTAPNYFAGNVGIANSAPSYPLDVTGQVRAVSLTLGGHSPTGVLDVQGSVASSDLANRYIAARLWPVAPAGAVQSVGVRIEAATGAAVATSPHYGIDIVDPPTTSGGAFGLALNVSSGASRYNIYAGGSAQNFFLGNVGIGTPPVYPLNVTGVSRFTDCIAVGTVNPSSGVGLEVKVPSNGTIMRCWASVDTDKWVIAFFNAASAWIGSINTNATATTYNTASDVRLKHNINPLVGGLETISRLNPVNFQWNYNDNYGSGFLAHEVQQIVPEAVTGNPDDVDEDGSIRPQGMDSSKLVPWIVAAFKEFQQIVEARLAALEARL